MQWLTKIVDELIANHPDGDIVVSSGVSPSGTYHLGTLREVLTAEAIAWEVRNRGRNTRHIHVVDDLDVFRKVPVGVPENYKDYLGKPLCDVPAPDGSKSSYADYYLKDLTLAVDKMHLQVEVMRAHERYRAGYFADAIEKALVTKDQIKIILETVSGHAVDENWSPVQVIEDGYLKNRKVVSYDTSNKTLKFLDKDNQEREISYRHGEVKLNWRVDWPARWWLLGVNAEPFGRDHATKGGSYDTGKEIVKDIYEAAPPLPSPYNFINRTGDTKKMSKSAGDVVTAAELLELLPPEVVWFFVLRYSPDKLLFFDEGPTLMRLVDEFSELLNKAEKTDADRKLIDLCLHGVEHPTVSRVPFSMLVASYQASLKDPQRTLEVIGRSEYAEVAKKDANTIIAELQFIDAWLSKKAPDDMKFSLKDKVNPADFSDRQRAFLGSLAERVETAEADAEGEWYHQAIYEFRETSGLEPKELFTTLYQALIGKDSGPRAGWFLSILPREWLIKRLRLEE